MPTFGEPDTPAPFHEDRIESPGEAQQRLGSWWLDIWRAFGVEFNESHQQAAAVLAGPYLKRWPILKKWKAPKVV